MNIEEVRKLQKYFFNLIFGQNSGIVCIAFLPANTRSHMREVFYNYPEQLDDMIERIEENEGGNNVYFCPQLLGERKRNKGSVVSCPNVWADLDTCHPSNLLVKPSVIIESSPGRYQGYWAMQNAFDPDDAENLARRIAYTHADDGCDTSGWDLTQLLRVPYTYNYKYSAHLPTVEIAEANRNLYRLEDFSEYPEIGNYLKVDIPMPSQEEMQGLVAEDLLQEKRMKINPKVWQLFNEAPEHDWSKALWNLQMLLFESGYSAIEVFVICAEAKCNKYMRDGRASYLLWKEVVRAEARSTINNELLITQPDKLVTLLNAEERQAVENAGDTFIERYQKWASELGDAAPQYHQAGAFICLSSLLCGSVKLPTSYGTIVPNIWFMILADTTLTRKTTSMDIAMDLIEEIDPDTVLATDGSIEGLLSSLATRPGRPSIFLRDEFSGLLEQMVRKDYMAGMPELLTKMYDGKMQKRILRKETIEVRDPRLIVFAGGIKNRITDLLTYEHVASGFIPRFVFITAESDIKRVRPIGPPSSKNTTGREAILAELKGITKYYNREQPMKVESGKLVFPMNLVVEAEMSDEAWIRYNELETYLLDIGLQSNRPDVMTPVGDRLAKSILKAAILIAASRQRNDTIIIEKIDILRAIKYGEQWRMHAVEILDMVGKSANEKTIENILTFIKKKEGASRSVIMQNYHLSSRDASFVFDTMEQRGLIHRSKQGRTEMLYAIV